VTLSSYLESQLALMLVPEPVRDAAESIIGNLDENGYLTDSLEEMAKSGGHTTEDMEAALKAVHSLDPAGVGVRAIRASACYCNWKSRNGKGGVAWEIIANHMRLVETRQFREVAKVMGRPPEHIQIAMEVIRHLDPRPGLRYSGAGARVIEPDVYIFKDGEDFIIQINDEGYPADPAEFAVPAFARQRDQEPKPGGAQFHQRALYLSAAVDEEHEQRKQTILKVLSGNRREARPSFLSWASTVCGR